MNWASFVNYVCSYLQTIQSLKYFPIYFFLTDSRDFLPKQYNFLLGTLQREYCFDVSLFDDNQVEGQESFTVVLRQQVSFGDFNLVLDPAVANVSIVDNDCKL